MKPREKERGVALVVVIFASTLLLLLLLTALIITRTSGRALARQLQVQGQATSAASAGLNEALSWFVHQAQQPVIAFDPKVDTGGVCTHVPPHNPLAFESEAPATGIVRSFEISAPGRVWGRYEVRRSAVIDISTRRGKTQPGMIWRVVSDGFVYVRNNASAAPNVPPNTVLARRTMLVDLQRLGLSLPGPNAALAATQGSNVNVIRPSRIQGGSSGIGVVYPASTGTAGGNGTISGNPAQNTTTNGFTLQQIFGVTQGELLAMADIVVDDESQLPSPLPDMALIVIRGNATFNPTRKLNGSGILVVLGNLILNPNSDAFYSGVVWVGGNFNMSPPGIINGAVVANGNAHLSGGNEVAEINYDAAILDQVRQQMGNYAFSRSPWIAGSAP